MKYEEIAAAMLSEILPLPPEREYLFMDTRNFRFDLAWPEYMIAVEIEGGTKMRTKSGYGKGHAHPKRFESDCEKYSLAAAMGWCVIRCVPDQMGKLEDWLRLAGEVRGLI